jgi:hypothetical protein
LFELPGVYVNENDFSQIIREANASRIGLLVDSDKGPVSDTPSGPGLNLVTSPSQYVREYGKPQTDLEHAALTAIRAGQTQGVTPYVQVKRALGDGAQWGGLEYDNGSFQDPGAVTYPDANYSSPSGVQFSVFARNPSDDNQNTGITVDPTVGESDEFQIGVHTRPDPSSTFSLQNEYLVTQTDKLDRTGDQMFMEDRINGQDDYIKVYNNPNDNAQPSSAVSSPEPLKSGASGSLPTTDQLVDAAQVFRDPNKADVRMLITGGETDLNDPKLANELFDIAASRKDMITLIDAPADYSAQDIANTFTSNITIPSNPENSGSYGAVYAPWVNDYEPENDRTVMQPPTGYVAQNMLVSFTQNEPWTPVAGPDTGILGVDELNEVFDDGQQTTLYNNSVNPVRNDAQFGPVIWGQKTFQQYASATDRINVRMLLITIELAIARFARSSLFNINDSYTRDELRTGIESYLRTVKGRRGIEDFSVKIDDENNPPSVRNNNKLVGDINIIPTKAAEVIQLNFNIYQNSAEFSESGV